MSEKEKVVKKEVDPGVTRDFLKDVYLMFRPDLKRRAAETASFMDDWLLNLLDDLLGVKD